MRIYIIHSPKESGNYFERIRKTEEILTSFGNQIINPLPVDTEEKDPDFDNPDFFRLHGNKITSCEMVFAMKDWCKSDIGNLEMSIAMEQLKTIAFEQ